MSGREPGGGQAAPDYVAPADVAQELSIIERLRNEIGGTDDYLEAILQNQRIMLMGMQQRMQESTRMNIPVGSVETTVDGSPRGYDVDVRPVPDAELATNSYLPVGAVGIASRSIFANDTGPATFQVGGTVFSTIIRATDDIPQSEPVKVLTPGNIAEPIEDVSLSILGVGASIGSDTFEVDETDQDVTIAPGETATVLEVPLRSGQWLAVGTNDETHSLYQYRIGNDELFEEPLKEPLGLYNDPFNFRQPLTVEKSIAVEVTRQSSASGAADYFSKVAYYE